MLSKQNEVHWYMTSKCNILFIHHFFIHARPGIIILIKCHLNEIIKDAFLYTVEDRYMMLPCYMNNVTMLQNNIKYGWIPCTLRGHKAIYDDIHIWKYI